MSLVLLVTHFVPLYSAGDVHVHKLAQYIPEAAGTASAMIEEWRTNNDMLFLFVTHANMRPRQPIQEGAINHVPGCVDALDDISTSEY